MAPEPAQALDLGLDLRGGDAPAFGQRRESCEAGREVAEVAGPERVARLCEAQVLAFGLGVEADSAPGLRGGAREEVLDVGLEAFGPLRQAGQGV